MVANPALAPSYAVSSPLGGVVLAGGLIGFAQKRSLPIAAISAVLGGGLLAVGYCIENPTTTIAPKLAHGSSCGLSWVVMAAMLPRAWRLQPMPIAVTVFATAATTYHAKQTIDWVRYDAQQKPK